MTLLNRCEYCSNKINLKNIFFTRIPDDNKKKLIINNIGNRVVKYKKA